VKVPSDVPVASVLITMTPFAASAPTPGFGIGGNINGYGSTRPAADGRFSLGTVPPGRYSLTARATVGAARGGTAAAAAVYWALADVRVETRDLDDILLTLQPATTVGGRVVFEGASSPPPDLSRVRVVFSVAEVPTGGAVVGAPPAQVRTDGTFAMTGVTPARYRVTASGATGWTLASARIGAGNDVLDSGLDVGADGAPGVLTLTFTDRPATLSGTLQDATGRPVSDYYVIAFAEDRTFWTWQSRRVQAQRPGTNGVFTFEGLPPGAYRIAAVIDVEPNEWFDPQYLETLVGASIPVALQPGERTVQSIRIR
jgi:hypothetical protein